MQNINGLFERNVYTTALHWHCNVLARNMQNHPVQFVFQLWHLSGTECVVAHLEMHALAKVKWMKCILVFDPCC